MRGILSHQSVHTKVVVAVAHHSRRRGSPSKSSWLNVHQECRHQLPWLYVRGSRVTSGTHSPRKTPTREHTNYCSKWAVLPTPQLAVQFTSFLTSFALRFNSSFPNPCNPKFPFPNLLPVSNNVINLQHTPFQHHCRINRVFGLFAFHEAWGR